MADLRALQLLPLLLALCAVALLWVTAARAADEIHWTMSGPTAVTFDWRGPSATLRYGLTSAYGLTLSAQPPTPMPYSSSGPFWQLRISGLMPGTIYHYSIAGGPDHLFRTASATAGQNFVIEAEADVGDSQTYPRVAAVQSLIAPAHPEFVLMIGDLTYANDHGQASVDTHYNDVMAWSQDAAYMPAWGNHEWENVGDDFRNYKGRFGLPNPQASPNAPALGGPGADWSWFDYGSVRFIAYPEPFPGAWDDWFARAKPLMDDAQANPGIHFIVTYGHRPAYSTGNHPGDPGLAGDLDALGATHSKYVLNVNGHSHNYERTYPEQGVTHITVGTGGSSLEEESGSCLYLGGCPPPAWSAFRAFHHGLLKLAFTSTSIHGQAICGPPGDNADNKNDITCSPGDVFDSFVIGADHPPVLNLVSGGAGKPGRPMRVTVLARDPDGDPITSLTADLSGLPADTSPRFTVAPGESVGDVTWFPAADDSGTYQVSFHAANSLRASLDLTLDVFDTVDVAPGNGATALAVTGIRPNPTASDCEVSFQLASASPARLELIDPRGRVLRKQDLGSLDPGPHFVRLGRTPAAAPGLYWIRLTQDRRSTAARVTFVR